MNIDELCEKYKVSPSSVQTNFPRVQQSILKRYKINITKIGRGKNAIYNEEVIWEEDGRAITIYEEKKDEIVLSEDSLKLINWEFTVFLAIMTTPMLVFRGRYADFLKYMDIKETEVNLTRLKDALAQLTKRDYIIYVKDKTDSDYFVATLYRAVEKEMQLGIRTVKKCKELADKHGKRNWMNLLKAWLGIQVLSKGGKVFTIQKLSETTGLSKYQLSESMKILKEDDMFISKKVYLDRYSCLGQQADVNAIYS